MSLVAKEVIAAVIAAAYPTLQHTQELFKTASRYTSSWSTVQVLKVACCFRSRQSVRASWGG